MAVISLTNGMSCLVDDIDLPFVQKHNWGLNYYGYARTSMGRKSRPLLHRLLVNAPKGVVVDHINGDKLDNRRSNLRLCTNSENIRNMTYKRTNKSGFKGVCWHKQNKSWCAQITFNRKAFSLGFFDDKVMAAYIYDIWALYYFKEFAKTNRMMGLLGA